MIAAAPAITLVRGRTYGIECDSLKRNGRKVAHRVAGATIPANNFIDWNWQTPKQLTIGELIRENTFLVSVLSNNLSEPRNYRQSGVSIAIYWVWTARWRNSPYKRRTNCPREAHCRFEDCAFGRWQKMLSLKLKAAEDCLTNDADKLRKTMERLQIDSICAVTP